VALGAIVSSFWFITFDGRYHPGPGGLFYPSVIWVRLWISGRPWWLFLVPPVILTLVAVCAALWVGRTLRMNSVRQPAAR
jgi:hypothetical protein